MVASIVLLAPTLGGLKDLFRLLHPVLHETEPPVYSNYSREAAAYTCLSHNLQRHTLAPLLNSGANAATA